jgi:WD40 repeat protein
VETGSCERVLEGHRSVSDIILSLFLLHSSSQSISCVCFCTLMDGHRVISGSHDDTLRVWDIETGSCGRVLEGHQSVSGSHSFLSIHLSFPETVTSVCTLSGGNRVVSGSWDNTLRVWNVETGSCVRVLKGHGRVSNCHSSWLCSSISLTLGGLMCLCLARWSSSSVRIS